MSVQYGGEMALHLFLRSSGSSYHLLSLLIGVWSLVDGVGAVSSSSMKPAEP